MQVENPLKTDDQLPLILVVDDDSSVNQIIAAVLEANGYRVICCEDAAQALAIEFETGSVPCLMITDYFMPNISGVELIRQMRLKLPRLSAVLTTGEVDEPEVEDSEAQPNGVLAKPFSPRELLACVRALVD